MIKKINFIKLKKSYGTIMYDWLKELFPINRSLTGEGVDQTLKFIAKHSSNLKITKIKSGTKVYDWTIPDEWHVKKAYIQNLDGKKIIDFKDNNLHLVGYSKKIDKKLSLGELKKNLHFIKNQPNLIPYVTSYYSKNWGFCISFNQLKKLKEKYYRVVIDSSFKKGNLKYGELYIKGKTKKEILFSTYICHPSMANNELSGPVVSLMLYKILNQKKNYYSYRFVFLPETIGSISFINKNLSNLKKNLIAGFVNTCMGDNNNYSFLSSRNGDTYADHVSKYALDNIIVKYKKYSFIERGSDERQYCSPGVDLPVCSVMRTKYGEYKEYHTSGDNLDYISAKGLLGSLNILLNICEIIEKNHYCKSAFICEPFMSNKKLDYPSISKKNNYNNIKDIMNIIAYSDGKNDTINLSKILSLDFNYVHSLQKTLIDKKILIKVK